MMGRNIFIILFIYFYQTPTRTVRWMAYIYISLVHSVLSFMCAQLNIWNIWPCVEILLLVYGVIVPGGFVKYAFCVKFYIIYKPNPSGKNRSITSFIWLSYNNSTNDRLCDFTRQSFSRHIDRIRREAIKLLCKIFKYK